MNTPRSKPEKTSLVIEGKTKKVYLVKDNFNNCIVESKDDITAGDGAKHDIIPNKAALATKTTCNVFRLLKAAGIPVAFTEQLNATEFLAPCCDMIKLEVVCRREAHGSDLKRNPHHKKGQIFPKLRFELYLKTSGKLWKQSSLPADDPLIMIDGQKLKLYEPGKPFDAGKPFLTIGANQVIDLIRHPLEILMPDIERIARRTFLVLERQWQLLGRRLVDFKIEFGFDRGGNLMVADVIDNDSWRLLDEGGNYVDKQVYRDGGELSDVARKYAEVAALSDRFGLPRQCVVLWCGSDKDNVDDFAKAAIETLGDQVAQANLKVITCSMHKQTAKGLGLLHAHEQDMPDSVIIAFIGLSNGAGPTLAGNSMLPVINCSPTVKDFPDEIWSSLRAPSDVPCMTVLTPKNALLAACKILAARNPALYAVLKYQIEERLE